MADAKGTPEVPGADILARNLPAVTSTSDMPDVAKTTTVEAPPVSESISTVKIEGTPAETPKVPAEDKTVTPPAEAKVETPPAETPKKKTGIEQRMSELTADKREAVAKAEAAETARLAAEANADALTKKLEDVLTRVDKVLPKPEEIQRPKRADYDDPDKYDTALEAYARQKGADIAKAETEASFTKQKEAETKKAAEDRQAVEREESAKEWVERITKAREENADWDEVALNPDLVITPVMQVGIQNLDEGAKVAYFLGKNPAEAERISKLNPFRAVAELGKIAEKLNAPPKTTTTPEPIVPITSGRNAASEKTPETESMEEYAARRTANLRAERARR